MLTLYVFKDKNPEPMVSTGRFCRCWLEAPSCSWKKGYNGVAIVSRQPLLKSRYMNWTGRQDCRYVWVRTYDGIGIHNFYVPAGGDVPDPTENPTFAHKLEFIQEMNRYFSKNQPSQEILLGDLNIAPSGADVWSSKQLLKVVSHTPVETDGLKLLMKNGGWNDAVREYFGNDKKLYSWWSYRARDWEKSNRGRRLDHIWVSKDLVPKIKQVAIHSELRGAKKPSDHVPVTLTL